MLIVRIPVYVINGLYLLPITLWTYLNYGRPPKPKHGESVPAHCAQHQPHGHTGGHTAHVHDAEGGDMRRSSSSGEDGKSQDERQHKQHDMPAHHHHGGGERPMFATLTIAVCHCGAGCVLGDVLGEWLVYGANITIQGRELWPAFLIGVSLCISSVPADVTLQENIDMRLS